jgi:hypothetical protein
MDDSIEAAPSEENGNVPAEVVETPSEPAAEATPAPVEAEPTTAPEELYELPDGRKVDAETLSREWKENFYPEFTRKSQELAKVTAPINDKPASPYSDPNYVPQTYEEIIKAAEERALQTIEQREADRIAAQKEVEDAVIAQLTEVKKLEPTLNESKLFEHANKYGFRDLKLAFQNMKDMREQAKVIQQETVKNIAKRTDPVSSSPGATGVKLNPDDFGTSVEYLRALKGQG